MKIKRLLTTPEVFEEDTLYLIKNNGALKIMVAGNDEGSGIPVIQLLQPIKVFFEITSIVSNGSKTYNVQGRLETILGVIDDYDLETTRVDVQVLDTDPASPTYNFYINSESLVTTGINNGSVKVINYAPTTQTIRVLITVNPKEFA